MDDRDKIDALQKLIDVKVHMLCNLMTTGMTWWVSSVVFCGSILAGTWIKHQELVGLPFINWFCLIVLIFLLSIVLFGVWLSITFGKLGCDIKELKAQLALIANIGSYHARLRDSEYKFLRGGTLLGTSSFVLIAVTWIGIWYFIAHG